MREINKRLVTSIVIHIVGWLIILFLPFVFRTPEEHDQFWTTNRRILMFGTIAMSILIFYINYLILIPRLLFKKRMLAYALSIISLLVVTYFYSDVMHQNFEDKSILIERQFNQKMHLKGRNSGMPPKPKKMRGGELFLTFLFLAVGTSVKVTQQLFFDAQHRKEIESEKLTAEVAFLKSQINPHFLFNTLNTIYSLALKKSDKTPESVIQLSELMRYIIYEGEKEKVLIAREIEYLTNLIDLQKLRVKDNVKVDFRVVGNPGDKQIEPLLFLPFVENAFKHGVDYSKPCAIRFNLEITEHFIRFTSENPIVQNQNHLSEGGIGLTNLKKRLDLIYKKNYKLTITTDNDVYCTELLLKL